MDDFEDLLDMEAEMEMEDNLKVLEEDLEEEEDAVGGKPSPSTATASIARQGDGAGGPPSPAPTKLPTASLGLTQELENLVTRTQDTSGARKDDDLTENELQDLLASQNPSQPAATEEDEEEDDDDDEEGGRESNLPLRFLYQMEGREYVTVTLEGGKRVYCTVNEASGDKGKVAGGKPRRKSKKDKGFLAVPVKDLMERVERRRLQKIIQESENLSNAVGKEAPSTQDADQGTPGHGAPGSQKLLAAKYAPRRFIELLSDEKTNREVVRWLKLWDHFVFGKPIKSQEKNSAENKAAPFLSKNEWLRTDNNNASNKRKSKWNSHSSFTKETLDSDGRPAQKVILFCGPPGFGKTTLAHIAAQQCGYRTIEVNASDDRNAGALRTRIMDAMQMQSMKDPRPTCLVIDEIDGAMGGSEGRSAITMLTQLIAAKRDTAASDREEGESIGRKRKRKSRADLLTRPMICICNDLYAPALRPLRDVARIFHFKRPDPRKITARLRRVCQTEKIALEGNALSVLCARSDGDIRTCLNTLEFLKRQQKSLSIFALDGIHGIGAKDKVDNVFNVMDSVFNTNTKQLGGAGASQSAMRPHGTTAAGHVAHGTKKKHRASQLYQKLMNFGDTDLVLSSCFENMQNVKYQDINLARTSQAADWFVFADEMAKSMVDLGEYSLNKYRVAAPIALNTLASAPGRSQLSWPRIDGMARSQAKVHASILHSWMSSLQPAAKVGVNETSAVMDVIPTLCHALVPTGLRPVAPDLMRAKERVTLKRVVDHMQSYSLSLQVNTNARDDASWQRSFMPRTSYCLQPQIDKFHRYAGRGSGGGGSEGITMNSAVKQIITHELETRKIRTRREAGVKESLMDKVKTKQQERALTDKDKVATRKNDHWLSKMRKTVENQQELRRMGGRDGTICREYAYPMLYTYHEGVTNAVKRRIVLKEIV